MAGSSDLGSKIQVLVLSSQADVLNKLELAFYAEPNYRATFTSVSQEALQHLAHQPPDIILVDDTIADGASIEAIRKLAIVAPATPIVALANEQAVEYVREALLAGARAFLTKPIHEADVFSTLNQLVEMEKLRKASAEHHLPDRTKACQILTVMGLKGGVGSTTLAVNLALTLQQQTGGQVILMDAHPRLSDLEATLNLQAHFTYEDLLQHGGNIDAELVRGMLTPHTSGVLVLPGGRFLEPDERASAEHFEQVLGLLALDADYIVIDNGALLSPHTEAALLASSHVLLVVTPEIAALRRTVTFLQTAEDSGFPREKIHLVLNRDGLEAGILAENISRHLNMQIAARIPEDTQLVTYSLNRGIPLVVSHPRSAVAKQIGLLAGKFLPERQTQTAERQRRSVLGRLSTLFQGGTA